jgi:hypothetical protein
MLMKIMKAIVQYVIKLKILKNGAIILKLKTLWQRTNPLYKAASQGKT